MINVTFVTTENVWETNKRVRLLDGNLFINRCEEIGEKDLMSLFVISYVVLIMGLSIIGIGTYQQDIALIVSGVSLVGSFVGMYASASNTKRQVEQDRPYIIFGINEERYNILQIEIYNAGNNGAIITEVCLDRQLHLMIGSKTLNERLKNTVIPAKGKVMYPYDVQKDWKKSGHEPPYVDVKGSLKYSDFTGTTFQNNVLLNLSGLSGQLEHKKESIKRDHEIIAASRAIKSLNENIKNIGYHIINKT